MRRLLYPFLKKALQLMLFCCFARHRVYSVFDWILKIGSDASFTTNAVALSINGHRGASLRHEHYFITLLPPDPLRALSLKIAIVSSLGII
jgi:hypothetical protein